ncbi:MAG TPA: TetR/AcrR family transcriptional regulator [Aliiroseovarius sp.]|nr:TetR/AcrR family transcriptional regulator [Aliiroseovarius sp.]
MAADIPRRTRKSAADRKAEIVETAVRLAGELGPDRVTTQKIADAVGLTQPAVFRHFPAKTDIWLAVGEWIAPAEEPEPAPTGASPAAELRAFVARLLEGIARNPAIPAILFSRELHAENEPLRAHIEKVMTRRRARFAALIARAQTAGQIPDRINADDMAALVLALVQGLAMRWSLENRRFDLKDEGLRLLGQLLPAPDA